MVDVLRAAYSDDAFGVGTFNCEADLARSRLIQRERRTTMFGAIDLRSDIEFSATREKVTLLGGPYNGRTAVVNSGQRAAWVIGDYEYVLRSCGLWIWSYDAMA